MEVGGGGQEGECPTAGDEGGTEIRDVAVLLRIQRDARRPHPLKHLGAPQP